MNESEAQQVLVVRAIERLADRGSLWDAADARTATIEARNRVGTKASFERFLVRRAEWVIEQLRTRDPGLPLRFGPPPWMPLVRPLGWAVTFLFGLWATQLFAGGYVNVIEWPIVALLAWNTAMYAWLIIDALASLFHRRQRRQPTGFVLRRLVDTQLPALVHSSKARSLPWVETFRHDYASVAKNLVSARFFGMLHESAACVALGTVASVYWRALGDDYRVVWKSTLLSAENVHAVARWVLGPGEWVLKHLSTAVRIPDLEHVARLHYYPGHTGELADQWIHLYAATIVAWIIVPRIAFATWARLTARRQSQAMPMELDTAYYSALRATWEGRKPRVVVVEFRYQTPANVQAGVRSMLERLYGQDVEIRTTPLTKPDLGEPLKSSIANSEPVALVLLFNLTAVALPGTHDSLVARLLDAADRRMPVAVIVDESSYPDPDPGRAHDRRTQWRQVLDPQGCDPVFVNLIKPSDTAHASLELRLDHRG